ncbi:hypothetical protein [Formosa maritima]|uniref:Histidine kinase N-terminal 7TM region domain-containing protein n=1 Tax=Formosa maritima TaxID=2592046 RepID=A0A5D0GKH1_9FLAO|nr:hypothetical protein [Formosa maritima]TYA59280.1 hypothetical protein FVF61_01315 [Formosa maritima]
MKDTLLQNYMFINIAVIFIAAFVGLLVFKKYKQTPVKYFIYFLIYVFVTEVLGSYARILNQLGLYYLIESSVFKFNFWWHTLTWYLGSAIFFAWYYRKLLKNNFLKSILQYALYLFLIISIGNIVLNFQQFFEGTFKMIRIGNMSIIMLSAVFYIYELLHTEKILEFYTDFHFYISGILLIWLLVTIPLVHFVCGNAATDPNQAELKWLIMLYANIFMYLSFVVALIFSKPNNDSPN